MRRSLTPRERKRMYEDQDGLCGCGCGEPLGEDTIGEHFVPVALGNTNKPDFLFRADCAKIKTRKDVREIARAKRLSGETLSQYNKRKMYGPSFKSRNTFQNAWGRR